ncbi:membrane protein [Pandoraea cepalis]|uniref:Membrane protein n=1 Tax=Pandoraea cepalis TaxID=2508294 RepID=A0A5E4YVI4_9BURK|nr:TPM domain-containing protein [Pandoraea cepalis]VVE52335.1 membrane protein [Pandoraea cepalis]
MNAIKAILLALIIGITGLGSPNATAQIAVPPLTARVTDQTGTLTIEQAAALDQTLQAFESRKGTQIAILIVPTTEPETIEQYSLRVVEQWKLGRKQADDGALLIVAKNDRTLRIEVGYGLEGALNDATSKRIISEVIVPRFQQGDFYGGIAAGVNQIVGVADGEPLPAPKAKPDGSIADIQQYAPVIFILVVVVGAVLRSVLGRFPGALVIGGAAAVVAWLFAGVLPIALGAGVIALLFTLISGGGGGMGGRGMGSLHGGYGGGGGFSGGGGGGGFGGGGASGRW